MYFKLIEGCINKLLEYSIYYGHTSVMVQLKNNTCKAEIKSDTSESPKKKNRTTIRISVLAFRTIKLYVPRNQIHLWPSE